MTVLSSNHSNFGIQPFFQTLHKSLEPGDASRSDDVAPLVRAYRKLVEASAPLATYARQQRRTHGPGFVCIDLSPCPEQNGTALDLKIGACTVTYHTSEDDLIALGLTDCKVAHALLHHDGAEGLAYVLRGQMGIQLIGHTSTPNWERPEITPARERLFSTEYSDGNFEVTSQSAPTIFVDASKHSTYPMYLIDGVARTHRPIIPEDYREYIVARERDGSMLVIADYCDFVTWAHFTPVCDGQLTTGRLSPDGRHFDYLDLRLTQTVWAVEANHVEDGVEYWGGEVYTPYLPQGPLAHGTPLPYVRFEKW